jgi:hypothetical protein
MNKMRWWPIERGVAGGDTCSLIYYHYRLSQISDGYLATQGQRWSISRSTTRSSPPFGAKFPATQNRFDQGRRSGGLPPSVIAHIYS